MVPGRDLGPVIPRQAKERIERAIAEAEEAGATVLVDGRNAACPGREGGFYVGPTIIDHVRPDMRIAQEEVFGPVLAIVRARDLDEAIAVENASPYGNAASVFTESGGLARRTMELASAGMVGVNVGVPVPREPFSFGGWNESKFGVGDITGRGSIEFWTQGEEDHDQVEPRGRNELDVEVRPFPGACRDPDRVGSPGHAGDDHTPRPYSGPSKQEVLAMRRQYCHPARSCTTASR